MRNSLIYVFVWLVKKDIDSFKVDYIKKHKVLKNILYKKIIILKTITIVVLLLDRLNKNC